MGREQGRGNEMEMGNGAEEWDGISDSEER
jgi:hypothetical protein